jgi:hypothetical protein
MTTENDAKIADIARRLRKAAQVRVLWEVVR